MATEFVAAVIALALFIIVSSVSKPLEKIPDVSVNKLVSGYVCRRRTAVLNVQMARVAEHTHSFRRCVGTRPSHHHQLTTRERVMF